MTRRNVPASGLPIGLDDMREEFRGDDGEAGAGV